MKAFDTYLMLCATKIRYLARNVKLQSFIADIKSKEKLFHLYGLLAYKANRKVLRIKLKNFAIRQLTITDIRGKNYDKRAKLCKHFGKHSH